jgi:hypothetical protein
LRAVSPCPQDLRGRSTHVRAYTPETAGLGRADADSVSGVKKSRCQNV